MTASPSRLCCRCHSAVRARSSSYCAACRREYAKGSNRKYYARQQFTSACETCGALLARGDSRWCRACAGKHNHPGTHGLSKSSEYRAWINVRLRCYDQHDKCYRHYGGRGITVCDSWRESFNAFYADMGPKPGPEYSIDRIDNEGNYEPSNCRWATPSQQQRNKGRRDAVTQ